MDEPVLKKGEVLGGTGEFCRRKTNPYLANYNLNRFDVQQRQEGIALVRK